MSTVWASLIAQWVKNPPAMQEIPVLFLGWKIRWRRDRLPTQVFLGFPCGSADKEFACNMRDLGLIPGLERYSGEGRGYPLEYSWISLVVQLVKNLPAIRETWVQSLGWKDLWRGERLPIPVFLGFPCGSAGKESACKAGDLGSIPGILTAGKWKHLLKVFHIPLGMEYLLF